MDYSKPTKQIDKDAIIALARKRMSEAQDADQDNRLYAMNDLEHIAGYQWPSDIRESREADGRPCITINRLPQFVRQVTGDIRQLNPAINVIPGDSEASEDVADVIEGLTRHIEYRSDASTVYEGAAESAAQCGMGFFRVLTEYEDDDTFNQEILIKAIRNPFSVYIDPAAEMSTREDMRYCFISEQVAQEDFKKDYPDAALVDADIDAETDGLQHWHEKGFVIVAEYFWKEPVKKKIGLLADGTVIENPQAIHNAVRVRDVDTHKVMWAKLSGKEVLEGPTEYPCKQIPVIAVMGEEIHIGETRERTSVIRFAKDPQRLYNYYSSAQAETIALQPKTPYIVTAKQIAGQEGNWQSANETNDPYLIYTPDEKAPGVPQRSQPPVSSPALAQEAMKAGEDMKATTGIYDAGLGQRSNEQSGVAIRQRQMESDVSTSIYTDNMAKAIGCCGRILVDMIPKIYDTQRIVRIVGKDDTQEMVEVNGMGFDPNYGAYSINALNIGKYDVRVSVGPNYTTRRQETADSMMQFVQAFPPAGQVAGDLIAKAMDWPDADKLAERLEKILPPGMIEQNDDPQAQQQAMMQQQAEQQAMQAQQQAAMAEQEAKMRKAQAEAVEAEAQAQEAQFRTQKAEVDLQAAILKAQRDQNAALIGAAMPQGTTQQGF